MPREVEVDEIEDRANDFVRGLDEDDRRRLWLTMNPDSTEAPTRQRLLIDTTVQLMELVKKSRGL